ncbi:DNA polymerase subunit gamma-1, mitochondrial isoform X2 [Belonocnema kinseyi]|uniref:DNA polymerase subunit gamma-1, mitochondrial isoform X2 n=1 Tax=Belonocnema kinseyi TaxID=2817044 RepID=UPI00143D1BDC|nr:DNA polymerase subunit gamma-1, mitochondrial isoform X2 [Belonocnema kinseyi]
MNSKLIGISIRHKCSDAISEVPHKELRKFSKKILHSKSKGAPISKGYFLTSKQTENYSDYRNFLSQKEFKVIKREHETASSENIKQNRVVENAQDKSGKYSSYRLTSSDMPVYKFVSQRNLLNRTFRATEYEIIKRSMSTFSNGYYRGSRCASTIKTKEHFIEDHESLEKISQKNTSIRVISGSKKYIVDNDLCKNKKFDIKVEQLFYENESFSEKPVSIKQILDQSVKKFRNKQSEYKIIKRRDGASKLKELGTKESPAAEINEDSSTSGTETISAKCSGTDNTNGNNNSEKSQRVNEINLQMLPLDLYKHIFPNGNQGSLSSEEINSVKEELKAFGLNVDSQTPFPNVHVEVPVLEGKDVEEHFYNIASAQVKPYLKVVNELIRKVPPPPENWILQEGWTRYTDAGSEKVDYPLEDGLIFDVEVCMNEGSLPTLATAVSKEAWYGWVSKSLAEGSGAVVKDRLLSMDFLIPLESIFSDHGKKLNSFQKRPKIVIGHNVSYDRARIKEQYWLNSTGTRFVDTMSMHVCVSGINSFQRALLKADKEDLEDSLRSRSSLNNLGDVHELYCGQKIDKKPRNLFVDGTLLEVREQFNDLMKYCASDVTATHDILEKLFPMFQERFPHPVTFAGMLELGSAYLPVNSNWQRYIEESESTFEDMNYEGKVILSRRADEVCRLMHNEKYKEDLWMWDQDWSTQDIKMKTSLTKARLREIEKAKAEEREKREKERAQEKRFSDDEEEGDPLEAKFAYLQDTKYLLPARKTHMPGYPNWYRKLCLKKNSENWVPGAQSISTSMQVAPKILNLTWENYPLHYIRDHGWGFLVPHSNDLSIQTNIPLKQLLDQCPLPRQLTSEARVDYAMATLRVDVQNDLHKTEFWRYKRKESPVNETFYKGSGIWCNVDIDNCCWFFKLPHKDGTSHKVGNPLAKDFLNKFSENVLAGLDVSASLVLKIAKMLSYWRNNRDRILSQMVIWFEEERLPNVLRKDKRKMRFGAIVPQVVVSGTLTRRAVEPTWMTASNAHEERIGSELRAMIQAPPGYNIVGADVDSQELWIASVIGDAHHAKIHGATPFGWMTLIGNKADGTDMHSVTAKAIGISRDHAKVINYARIYGAGQKFAERLLKQFNPSMTEAEAASKSKKMFVMTKGKKVYRLKKEYVSQELEDKEYSASMMFRIAKIYGKTAGEMFEKGQWIGGSESAMFNRLEEIAGSLNPATPFLNSRLSRALEGPGVDEDKYLPTKVNWVVQSGAVDFLHLMLVSMRWLMRDNARFCLSFHDEIRYLVSTKYKYNAALAMHITNLLTRSFCSSRLGIQDLPMSVAFFTSVEVDTVLRKEASADCKTPSNPHGLESGYEISPGENLDIWKAIEKSGGLLGSWHASRSRMNAGQADLVKCKEGLKEEIQIS